MTEQLRMSQDSLTKKEALLEKRLHENSALKRKLEMSGIACEVVDVATNTEYAESRPQPSVSCMSRNAAAQGNTIVGIQHVCDLPSPVVLELVSNFVVISTHGRRLISTKHSRRWKMGRCIRQLR